MSATCFEYLREWRVCDEDARVIFVAMTNGRRFRQIAISGTKIAIVGEHGYGFSKGDTFSLVFNGHLSFGDHLFVATHGW